MLLVCLVFWGESRPETSSRWHLHGCHIVVCLKNLFFPFLPWRTFPSPSFLSGKRRRWKGKTEERKSRKNSCSTQLTAPPWKQSALRTLTGEFVEAMELTMGRVCRKWDICSDSPDSGAIKVLKSLTIEGEKKAKNWYYDPSDEGQDLLWVGAKSSHKVSRGLVQGFAVGGIFWGQRS